MVRSGKFELDVLVGGKALPETVSPTSGDAWVESLLDVEGVTFRKETVDADPFGETFTQSWPVTPFTVRVTNHSPREVYAECYVDGKKAGTKHNLKAGEVHVFEGWSQDPSRGSTLSDVSEFLFSVPRRLRQGESDKVDVNAAKALELETVRVAFSESIYTGSGTSYYGEKGGKAGIDSANKAVAKAAGASVTASAGRTTVTCAKNKQSGPLTVYYYNKGAHIGDVKLKYTTKDKLNLLGLDLPKRVHPRGVPGVPKPDPADPAINPSASSARPAKRAKTEVVEL